MAYLGKSPSQGVRNRYYFTASGGETSISGAITGGTLTFSDGNYVDVTLNGVTLVAGTDYNTSTANTISGLTALTASDVVEIVVYDTFSVFSGNVNSDFSVGGNLTITGTTTTSGNIELAKDAPQIDFNDTAGGTQVDYRLKVDAGEFSITDVTNSYEQVEIAGGIVKLRHNGSTKFSTTSTGIDVTGNITVSGNVDGRNVASDGSKLDGIAANATADDLTNLSATNLTSGTIPDARFPATLPALDGSNLTNLPASGLPSGTKALFVQTAAPTGWTKDTTHNNKALRIVSGSVGTGGSSSFTSAFGTPSLSISISGSTGSTTISTSTMPSHNHGITSVNSNQAGSYYVGHGYGYSFSSQGTQNTNSTGGGGSHNHSLSASASGTAAINVQYVDVIIATKD
jgi:hypothetical protein